MPTIYKRIVCVFLYTTIHVIARTHTNRFHLRHTLLGVYCPSHGAATQNHIFSLVTVCTSCCCTHVTASLRFVRGWAGTTISYTEKKKNCGNRQWKRLVVGTSARLDRPSHRRTLLRPFELMSACATNLLLILCTIPPTYKTPPHTRQRGALHVCVCVRQVRQTLTHRSRAHSVRSIGV